MADKILSQDEVEALLQGVSEGTVDTQQEPVQDPGGTHAYDLTNQERIIRGNMPSLDIVNERFARFSQLTIASLLKRDVEVVPGDVALPKFAEFMRKIPLPSSINIIKMSPLKGYVLLVISAKMIYRLVDLYFGGSGQTYVKIEGRDFTTIEQRIIQKVVDQMLVDLERAWRPVFPVAITHTRSEINPQFASVVAPTEVIVSSAFKLEMEGEGGEIYIGLPYPTVEPIREKLYGGGQTNQLDENVQWKEQLSEHLVDCTLGVTVELGGAALTVKEVIDLSPGDTILLNKNTQDDLEMKVEGQTFFSGRPGRHNGNVAVQITSMEVERKEEKGAG